MCYVLILDTITLDIICCHCFPLIPHLLPVDAVPFLILQVPVFFFRDMHLAVPSDTHSDHSDPADGDTSRQTLLFSLVILHRIFHFEHLCLRRILSTVRGAYLAAQNAVLFENVLLVDVDIQTVI